MTNSAYRFLLTTTLLLLSWPLTAVRAQVTPALAPSASHWLPKPPPLPLHELGGLLVLDVASLKRSMNVYQQATVRSSKLYQRPMRVKGYGLDTTLRRQWPNVAELSRQGATLTFKGRTAAGEQSIEVKLADVYGKGGLLAYAESGYMPEGWSDTNLNGQTILGTDVGIYLVWPKAKLDVLRPLPEVWQISMIMLHPARQP